MQQPWHAHYPPGMPTTLDTGGSTTVVKRSAVAVTESPGELRAIPAAASVADVAAALNALGAKPRDLIAILRSLAAVGALHAQLEVL